MAATLLALIVSNTGAAWYPALLETPAKVMIGELVIHKPLLLWINDGLMAVFFLLVGLELKREVLYGELSEWKKITLPLAAAIGGLCIPALIYVAFNVSNAEALNGWAKVPKGVSWRQLYGLGCLCGVGLTMSLFIASLAFEGSGAPVFNAEARLGILAGSILSGLVGYFILRTCSNNDKAKS